MTYCVCGGKMITTNSALICARCGKPLEDVTQIPFLNGNEPYCNLCWEEIKQSATLVRSQNE